MNYKKLLLKISSFQLPSQFLVNLHQQLLLVIFLRKKRMRNFWNILIHRGLFEILNFSFQTTSWIMLKKKDDEKPGFWRALTDWIENWCNEKVPSFEQFPFSLSTVKALIRNLRCQVSLHWRFIWWWVWFRTSLVKTIDCQKFVISTIVFNVFFNNKRTISTASVKKDHVASFKKQKRQTIFLWYSLITISL